MRSALGLSIYLLLITTQFLHATQNNANVNLHFFVIFAKSPLQQETAAYLDESEGLTPSILSQFAKISARIYDQNIKQTSLHSFRLTYTSIIVEESPLGIVNLHSALQSESFEEKSPFVRRQLVLIVGKGPSIQKAIIAVRAALSLDVSPQNAAVFVYDVDFFNHANVTSSIYQLNQDRRSLVAPLLASTVLHKSNPKGSLVILIHDVILASDQLYIAAHSLFNTLVLVTDDQSEDVFTSNLRNEITPILSNVLLTQTVPAATFVVHVANSKSVAKIFSTANRLNLLGYKFIWIVTDQNAFVAKMRGRELSNDVYLKPPVKPYVLPQNLIALHADQIELFNAALTKLFSGLAKSLATSLTRVKAAKNPRRLWHRSTQQGYLVTKPIDLPLAHLFEADGSVITGNRRGGAGRYSAEEARYVTAVQLAIDKPGNLKIDKVSLKNIMHTASTIIHATTTLSQPDQEMLNVVINGSTSGSTDTSADTVITDGAASDDVIPHLLQVFISLGPPYLFDKPMSPITGECIGSNAVICDRIVPGSFQQLLPAPTLAHRCCSGLVPDLVRTLSRDLKVNARIVVAAGGEAMTNTSMALDLLNRRIVDMVFTADPYIGHKSTTRYYVTESYFTSSYAMLVAIRRKEPSLFAFLSPFPATVWIGIILMLAPVTAISISQFEWNSPFGLNPWGRKRSTNYTLGSALNMVYALLFGHTVKTKCPKAWPSKWTQNFWAGFAIFVIASYTGNLASFLAKRHESIEFDSIYDLADSDHKIKVGIVRDDPILGWLRLAVTELTDNIVVVKTLEEATRQLRQYELDVIVGEVATIRYWQLTEDANLCSTKLLSRSFADRELAPAMLVDSQFRATVAGKMREYKITGEFEQLISKNRFASLSQQGGGTACGIDQAEGFGGVDWARQAADTQLTLSHANGLFLTMVLAIVLCCFILVAEHLTYFYVVPKLRQEKRTSPWRGFGLMYFSQRLYRILNSEELLRPTQVLKEMLEVIKRLEFSRIFQKSARKKRFRKITIAEFVQQVKDEKDKKLPDIVVQTKGLHRAKRAWYKTSPGRHNQSIEDSTSSSSSVQFKKGLRASDPQAHRKSTSSGDSRSRFHFMSVRHHLVSSTSQTGSRITAELELRNKFQNRTKGQKVDYSKSLASTLETKRLLTQMAKERAVHAKSDFTGSPSRWAMQKPKLEPITDSSTPNRRWMWVREKIKSDSAKQRRATMLTVYKEEMDKIISGKQKLEDTVIELKEQLEKIKRERDKLIILHELEKDDDNEQISSV